jgi:hypothetical protein
MDFEIDLVRVAGLREADLTLLAVMSQDLLLHPLGRLSQETLTDLFAIADLGDALPHSLRREMSRWKTRMQAEVRDLPDGGPLIGLLKGLDAQGADAIPAGLRTAVVERCQDPKLSKGVISNLERLVGEWDRTPPTPATPGVIAAPLQFAPARLKPSAKKRKEPGAPRKRAAKKAEPVGPASADTAEGWLHRYFIERLSAYSDGGLKERMLVAGAIQRSPHAGVNREQVIRELRRLKTSGQLVESAGRWRIKNRW